MSRKTSDLTSDFVEVAEKLIGDTLRHDGHMMRLFFTLRDPAEQARLWRQSRTTQEIHKAASVLDREGAPFLAQVLVWVGPQLGRWATNALPGQSWHQWGEAIDCFALINGRAVWRRSHPAYEAYANRARSMGLEAGYFWRAQDAVHVQVRKESVRDQYTWSDVDRVMQERFPDLVTEVMKS